MAIFGKKRARLLDHDSPSSVWKLISVGAEVLTGLTSTKCPDDFLKGYSSNRGRMRERAGLKLAVFL